MKKQLLVVLMVVFAMAATAQLRVASYNVRFDNARDSGNLWQDRSVALTAVIRFHDFDIFGTQEGLRHQLDDIQQALPAYAYYGAGRDDGGQKGEHSAIFFKKDAFKLLGKGDFWLSQTPEKPSLGWDATCCNRICSWVYLQEVKTGRRFYFFNAHYDHEGVQARLESSRLILDKIKEIAGDKPVILTGDFNGGHDSEWYQRIARSGVLKDAYGEVKYPYALNGSYNGWGRTVKSNEIIDHIFVSRHFKVQQWGVLTDTYHGKYPSDHFPVMAEMK